jgi:hypothetical protein
MTVIGVPSVGRIVHYTSYGTPGGEYTSECRAAIVTEVDPGSDDGHVGLAVLNPAGLFFRTIAEGGCIYDDGAEKPGAPDCPSPAIHGNPFRYCACGWAEARHAGGTWHWPERAE